VSLAGLWAALAALAPAQIVAPGWGSVEREWRVRSWALDPALHASELRAALAEENWIAQAAALESLRRALDLGWLPDPPGAIEPLLVRAMSSPSPVAQASALEALAEWPRTPSEAAESARELQHHPLPAVRIALARFVRAHGEGLGDVALALALDGDPRVASEGALALLHHPRELAEFLAGRAPLAGGEDEEAALLDLVDSLERASTPDGVLRAAAEAFALSPSLSADSRRGWSALFEALRLRLHASGDPRVIAAGWTAASPNRMRRRGLFLRAARAARAQGPSRGPALGEALLERACADPAQARDHLEGAVEAFEPQAIAGRALALEGLDLDARLALWDLLTGRARAWALEATGPWLDPSLDLDLRRHVVLTLAETFGEHGDPGSAALLERALADPDPTLAGFAFRALASARDPRPYLEGLHAAWLRLPRAEQIERLERLPRSVAATPFRGDLLGLASEDRRARPRAVEVLEAFLGDAEIASAIQGWLAEELGALAQLEDASRHAAELRANALVRALHRLQGEAAVPALAEVLARTRTGSLEVAKLAAWALGQSAAGREVLRGWLGSDVPRRLRIEAALALAPVGSAQAVDVLIEDYPFCDRELKDRALRAFAPLRDGTSLRFTAELARSAAAEVEHRMLAIEALLARGADPPALAALERAVEAAPDTDSRRAAIEALGKIGGAAAREFLLSRLASLERDPAPGVPRGDREIAEREALLAALGDAGAFEAEVRRAWLEAPFASAARDLQVRFEGRRLAATEFAWRAELDYAGDLARAGRLGSALDESGPWWRLDARLLVQMAAVARAGELDAARRLVEAGIAGLHGEGEGEDTLTLLFQGRLARIGIAEARRDWRALAHHLGEMLDGFVARRVPERAWRREFGEYLPARGVDPTGRLESARLQALARAALEEGERAEARRLAQLARARLGASRAAMEAQETLERDVE